MMFDIQSLRIIWWLLLGILFIGFAVTDGFDLGAAILFPFVARNEKERTTVLNSIGPFWEGNQVWIILGAGAIFAAWPYVYAVAFSGFYFLILLLLLTLGISRPVSFKYRSKLRSMGWRRFWDRIVFIGGLFPAFIFGMLVGNVLLGAPFYFNDELRLFYSGTFTQLFQPFALWCGLTSVCMLVMHGGLYLAIKTNNPIRQRAIMGSRMAAFLLMISFAIAGYWIAYGVTGYEVLSGSDPEGFSNPLYKQVVPKVGAWLDNYSRYPFLISAPLLGFLGAMGAIFTARFFNSRLAFIFSSFSIIGVIATVGVSMFPFILPSSINLASSLLVWDASSSQLTLLMMLFATLIFIPLILVYTSWVYYVLRGKAQPDDDEEENKEGAY